MIVERNKTIETRKFVSFVVVGFGVFFLSFIWGYENYTIEKRYEAVEAYAGVISNSLWHFESQAPTDYLTLIVNEQNYEYFKVFADDGLIFVDVEGDQPNAFNRALIALKLIQRVEITADITYDGNVIGEISAVWLNSNIFTYFYVLLLIILLIGVIWLYWRIIHSKRELEIRVRERTEELHNANLELRESEARYRGLFEDSPISLREDDFSKVKNIIDRLRVEGVDDFNAYFRQHPEMLSDCVQAVKVLNVNQNMLELFGVGTKARLYPGLMDLFTEDALISFGKQLAAFAAGKYYFEGETIQQTLKGEKVWVGIGVSIAPGYEDTWEKVFVSIVNITDRKQAEAELVKYHEHLEDLVTARTTELVALQHDLEQRVEQRTEELAQVNQGLNAEIVERKRLQEEVQRYTEELEQRVDDRNQKLSVLYDVTAVASQEMDLDELLSRSLERALAAMRCKAGVIHLMDEEKSVLGLYTIQGVSEFISDGLSAFLANEEDIKRVFEEKSALVIPDLSKDSRVSQIVRQSRWHSYVGVPIEDTRGKFLGVLGILAEARCQLNKEELTLLASIADHIGLAVENVRLRRQAEETAVLEDRQRLARELHDAVNQSLFSASVIAETLPRLWESKPLVVQQQLEVLHKLIRGALAEMRIMLLELRPVSMTDALLEELLQQLVDGIKGHSQLSITLQVEGECEVPTREKKNLFRIAQEALNNVVKHARAQQVLLTLNQSDERIVLHISDDGQGFDMRDVDDRHMGLQIMRERAKNIGANLNIDSYSGTGTRISVIWPDGV